MGNDQLRLRTLGEVSVETPDGQVIGDLIGRPKAFAVLTYLACDRRCVLHQRDTLLAVFWPNADQEHSRNCLRQTLHTLRSCLGTHVVVGQGRTLVGIDPDMLRSDVRDFTDALDAVQLAEALEIYGGDFLSGFFIADAPDFEHWVDQEQVWLRDRAVRAAWKLAEKAEQDGDHSAALRMWEQLGDLAPLDEAAFRRHVESLLRAGSGRADIIALYTRFVERTMTQLGAPPPSDLGMFVATALLTPESPRRRRSEERRSRRP